MVPLLLLLAVPQAAPPARVVPLANAHAHNDYYHRRPLLDALAHGFCSVEADIFLDKNALLVGHYRWELRLERTLERLYLQPLAERARAGDGAIYPGGPPILLLIDIKTDGPATYRELDRLLSRYSEVLSCWRDGKFEQRAVTVVISGNCPREVICSQAVRYAGIDGRPSDLRSKEPAHLMPLISAAWGSEFRWRGEGEMPAAERKKLLEIVKLAHAAGRKVRFWSTPEKPALWRELRAAGVDLINTDQLAQLRDFLLEHAAQTRSAP